MTNRLQRASAVASASAVLLAATGATQGQDRDGDRNLRVGAISGVVQDAVSGAAVSDAIVYLGLQGAQGALTVPRTKADSSGRFRFLDVPPGMFFLHVS